MNHDPNKYLSDIDCAILLINNFIQNYSFVQYQEDLKTKSAVERQLGIIGEAVNNYSKTTNSELLHSRQIIAFRNRLIHAYDSTEDEIVWAIVKNHLPELGREVKKEIKKTK